MQVKQSKTPLFFCSSDDLTILKEKKNENVKCHRDT